MQLMSMFTYCVAYENYYEIMLHHADVTQADYELVSRIPD